jgi:hypothetical protein
MDRGFAALMILILSSTLLWIAFGNNVHINVMPPPGAEPRFIGYRSNPIRIETKSLTALKHTAIAKGYNVTSGCRGVDADWLEAYYYPTLDSSFQLTYSPSMNETYFHFTYPEKSNATMWLWETLQDSLSLNDSQLKNLRDFTTSEMSIDASGANLGTYIPDTKPDWAKVVKHLGAETGRDTSMVGVLKITYGDNVRMTLRQDSLLISGADGKGVVCVVNIDGDSDLCLYVDSSEKLENPIKLFNSMFGALGIPDSELAKLSLEESWAYPV